MNIKSLLHGRLGHIFLIAALLAGLLGIQRVLPVRAASGGPDAGGYTWTDAPGIHFIDISSSNTALPLQDGQVLPAQIGFNFIFYGVTYSSLYVCSNGVLQFQNANLCSFRSDSIPKSNHNDPMIAALWGDLNPAQGGQVEYATTGSAPNRIFVLEFDHVLHFGTTNGSSPATFQVQLYETSNIIEVHYQDAPGFNDYLTGLPAHQSAGIEKNASTGLQYYYDLNFLSTPRAVRYQTQPPIIDTSIINHPSNPTKSTTAAFSFSGSEVGGGFLTYECRLDADPFQSCDLSTKTYTNLADGSHTFAVYALDQFGAADATPAVYTWLIDSSLPNIPTLLAPADSQVILFPFTTLKWGACPGAAGYMVKVDGKVQDVANILELDLTTIPPGPHTWTVESYNSVGTTLGFGSAWNFYILTNPQYIPKISR